MSNAGSPAIVRAVTGRRRRQWPFVVVGVVAVLLVLAAVCWFIWLPRYRPHLHADERIGIDVSAHQGRIDWAKVRRDGVSFAYIKATEGGDFVDRSFGYNWAGARVAGLERGAYHFYTLCAPGQQQAENFVRVLGPDPGTMRPAVDLELKGNCRRRPSAETVRAEIKAFLDTVESRTGRPTVLYLGHEFEARYPTRALGRPIWLRRFLRRPSESWTIWQVHGFARVDGISGRVDLDVLRQQRLKQLSP